MREVNSLAGDATDVTRRGSTTVTTNVDPRMDERVTRTRSAVVQAASELLVEGGPGAVTVDAIVLRSGVAKSTIYRHWASRDEILIDVIDHLMPTIPPIDPALGFADAVHAFTRTIVTMFSDPEWARVIPSLLLLKQLEPAFAQMEKRLEDNQFATARQLYDLGVAEGLVDPALDFHVATSLLMGPLLFAHLSNTFQLDAAFGDHVADAFLRAHAPDAVVETKVTPRGRRPRS